MYVIRSVSKISFADRDLIRRKCCHSAKCRGCGQIVFMFGGRGGMNKRSAFVVVDRSKDFDKFVSVQIN
jgi:hypothetical protein